ncbi:MULTISPECIES: hypothetical protein [Bacillaceae]|uniref:Uncharacterized protein n=1 Tax=Evansella alkalicola TaxID=745819 RepID=A0ABS6JZW4_9BACI|nr:MULTISPECIES: hypothetical protein [Bacillaceae]MBU9724138.1 hypothetical protein [Bacillus alkalicola]
MDREQIKLDILIKLSKVQELERNVYFFMFGKYNDYTKSGEDYIGEKIDKYDKEISELASREYGISEKEAGDIYTKIEMLLH